MKLLYILLFVTWLMGVLKADFCASNVPKLHGQGDAGRINVAFNAAMHAASPDGFTRTIQPRGCIYTLEYVSVVQGLEIALL